MAVDICLWKHIFFALIDKSQSKTAMAAQISTENWNLRKFKVKVEIKQIR